MCYYIYVDNDTTYEEGIDFVLSKELIHPCYVNLKQICESQPDIRYSISQILKKDEDTLMDIIHGIGDFSPNEATLLSVYLNMKQEYIFFT